MGGLKNGKEGEEEAALRSLKLGGHVGFDSMPDQLVNKSVQNGFCFNILSIGETGIGKSTLADSLFNTRKRIALFVYCYSHRTYLGTYLLTFLHTSTLAVSVGSFIKLKWLKYLGQILF